MRTRNLLAALLAAAALAVPAAAAQDQELTGTFIKKAGDFDLTFEFKKDKTFNFKMTNGTDGIEIDCKYTHEKDGTIKAEVTKGQKMGNFPKDVDKGYKFTFKVKKDGKKLAVSDIEGEGIDDAGKDAVNGDYEEK